MKKVKRKRYLTPEQLADRWCINVGTLRNWRSFKRGPKYLKHGQAKNGKAVVRYDLLDIEIYEKANTISAIKK